MNHHLKLFLIFCFSFSTLSHAHSDIKRPYKKIEGKIAYQFGNKEPVFLEGASLEHFHLKYVDDYMAVAESNGNWYCNGTLLGSDFEADTAQVMGSLLLSNSGNYAYCSALDFNLDAESVTDLDYPFFKDANHVFTTSGELLKNADAQTFTAKRNQGFDNKHYFFVERDTITLPYSKKVTLHDCFGWAQIDGELYYKAEKRTDVDKESYRCLDFYTAVDKNHIYNYGEISATFKPQISTANLTPLNEYFLTDGTKVWYLNVETFLIEGLDISSLTVDKRTISDNKQTWQCESAHQEGSNLCKNISNQ